jgi:hypothetical protein
MNKIKYTVLLVALCAGMTSLAHASLSAPTPITVANANSTTQLAAFIAFSGDTDATVCDMLSTSDPFPGSDVTQNGFTYSFGQLASGQFTVTVTFDLAGTGQVVCGFAVKNGTLTENFYTVSADEGVTNSFTLLVPANSSGHFGQLSGVWVFCCPGGTVPDGGTTVMLLGAGLSGLGLLRRFVKR